MNNKLSQIPHLEVKTYKSGNYVLKTLEGAVYLPSWKGYQSRQGDYRGRDKDTTSNGWIKLMVGDDFASGEPEASTEHVQAYQYLVEQQDRIKETILSALLPAYQDLREQYGYSGEEDAFMPVVKKKEQFKNLIGLSTVHILDVSKDGMAYVSYEFGCTWDEEHGLGIMTYKDRVIEIGPGETAFTTSIVETDADPVKEEAETPRHKHAHESRHKKPWWKFW